GHPQIDPIDFAPVELVGGVQAFDRLAGDGPGLRILERDALGIGRGQLGRRRRHFAVGRLAARGPVRDHAFGHRDLAHRHLPFIGGGPQQHHARRRTPTADVVFGRAYAATTARAHLAPHALARVVLTGGGRLGFYV